MDAVPAVGPSCRHEQARRATRLAGVALTALLVLAGCQSQPEAADVVPAREAADTALRLYTHPPRDAAATGPSAEGGAEAGPNATRCDPPCAADEVCYNTSCVKRTILNETRREPLPGRIIQLVPDGARTRLVLDKGAKQGVKVGGTGTITGVRGHRFEVIEVYPFRATAVIDLDDKAIGDHRDVTLAP
ncbi:MAG: hypothetical protein EP329_23885 [Deltaproteobacteria bacterium]|nr:MAG: hypothetical protein EP329_23885 [Deltaproteobacteria bacterium]